MQRLRLLLRLDYVIRSSALALLLSLICTSIVLAEQPASDTAYPARLVIPSIDLDQSVSPVGIIPVIINNKTYRTWDVLDDAVGWHNRSAAVGQVGNTVLSGHSDIHAQVFRDLKNVMVGDDIVVYSHQQAYRYRITEKFLVQEKGVSLETRKKNAQWIAPTDDERLTMITCAQPGATHRLIVIARPVAE